MSLGSRDPHRLDRRQTIGLLGAGLASAVLPSTTQAAEPDLYAAGARQADGSFAIVVLDGAGRERRRLALPARGHDMAHDAASGLTVAFARRPGTFALAFQARRNETTTTFACPADRHFCGHGAFSADGRVLYAPENDWASARGVIGVYDVAAGFVRIGEWFSGGIGPHEVLLMPDRQTLAIANGGILTHPDWPRAKLNLETMAPNLAYLDTRTGDLTEQPSLPATLNRLSIRHLSPAGGALWFGCQWEGDSGAEVALVGRHRPGRAIELLSASHAIWSGMNHYIGSLATSGDGRFVATSSPRGGTLTLWDAESGETLRQDRITDVSGLASSPHGALAIDGTGRLHQAEPTHVRTIARGDLQYDNHARRLASR